MEFGSIVSARTSTESSTATASVASSTASASVASSAETALTDIAIKTTKRKDINIFLLFMIFLPLINF